MASAIMKAATVASQFSAGSEKFTMQKLSELEKLLKQGQGALDRAQKNKAGKNKEIAKIQQQQQQANQNEKNAGYRMQQLPTELATTSSRIERESADALEKRLLRNKEEAEKALRSRMEQLKKESFKTEKALRDKLTSISRNKVKRGESLRKLQDLKTELERYIAKQSEEVAKKTYNYAEQQRIAGSLKRVASSFKR